MFDHMVWWQALLILLPLVAIMKIIRYREDTIGTTPYKDLSPMQKSWVLVQLMPPALSAKFLQSLNDEQRQSYFAKGQAILGGGLRLHEPVIKEYLAKSGLPLADSEANFPQERLAKAVLSEPDLALAHLRNLWPIH